MYNYAYGNPGEHLLRSFVMIYLVCLFGIMIIGAASYVLKSYGLYKIAGKKGMENAWAAWIPFLRVYYQGEISGTVKIAKKELKRPGIWLLLLPVIGNVLAVILVLLVVVAMMFTGAAGSMPGGFLIFGILPGLAAFFGIAGVIAVTAFVTIEKVLRVFVNRKIYNMMTEEGMALLHAIAGLFIPCYESVCIFYYSRKI